MDGVESLPPSPPKTLRLLSSERRRGTGMEKTASFFLPEKHEMMFPQDLKYEQVSSICRRNQISVPSPGLSIFLQGKIFSLQSFPLSPSVTFEQFSDLVPVYASWIPMGPRRERVKKQVGNVSPTPNYSKCEANFLHFAPQSSR